MRKSVLNRGISQSDDDVCRSLYRRRRDGMCCAQWLVLIADLSFAHHTFGNGDHAIFTCLQMTYHKAISSMGSSPCTMSSTSLLDDGLSCHSNQRFGNRQRMPAMRFPVPAIGIMIFILSNVLQRYRSGFRLVASRTNGSLPGTAETSGTAVRILQMSVSSHAMRAYLADDQLRNRSPG